MPPRSDKKVRLTEAAKVLIHRQGYNLTSLADIATLGNVPLGNVYYYFKTKELIGSAVIEAITNELHEHLLAFESNENPKDRLKAFLNYEFEQAHNHAQFGCPIGSLCQELAKQSGPLAVSAANLINEMIIWSEKQFKSLGCGDESREFALRFIPTIQGAAVLANTFNNPELMRRLIQDTNVWLDNLAKSNQAISAAA